MGRGGRMTSDSWWLLSHNGSRKILRFVRLAPKVVT